MGKTGKLKFVVNSETILESCGLPKMDSKTGKFYDSPYENGEAPLKYKRIVAGLKMIDWKNLQYDFLRGIKDNRFLELQKITGAYQGKLKPNHNQLLDAFHLWCAEYNKCNYFLTLDFRLIKVLTKNNRGKFSVELVKPSELRNKIKGTA